MKELKYWKVIPVGAQYEHALGADAPAHSEWARLMVGRVLAPAQRDQRGTWEFLVQGIPLESLAESGGVDAFSEVEEAVKADFKVLRSAIDQIRHDLHAESESIDNPYGFVRVHGILPMLKLPTRPERWEVTDEGLTIVGWGTKGDSLRLKDWDECALANMERVVLDKVAKARPPASAPTLRPPTKREPEAESSALRENRQQVRSEKNKPVQRSRLEARAMGNQGFQTSSGRDAPLNAGPEPSLRSAIARFGALEWCAAAGVVLAILAVGLALGTWLRGKADGGSAKIAQPDATISPAPAKQPPRDETDRTEKPTAPTSKEDGARGPKQENPGVDDSTEAKGPPEEKKPETPVEPKESGSPGPEQPVPNPQARAMARDAEAAVPAPRMTVGG